MKYLLLILVLSSSIGLVSAQKSDHALTINLTINTTIGKVYVSGAGERDIAGMSAVSAPASYIASYRSNVLYGIVYSQAVPLAMQAFSNATDHFLSLSVNLTNSQVFVAFTQGDYRKIEQRMPLIRRGTFLDEIYPSFGFPLGTLRPITLMLNYSDIDIQGNLTFRRGTHILTVESQKVGSRKIVVLNESVES